jgi:hypothetical protein
MAGAQEPNGKNSLVGEFLLALARAPEPIQEAIIIWGLKKMQPFAGELIAPYPMMSHMVKILRIDANDETPKKS